MSQYLDFQYGPRYFGIDNYAESREALQRLLAAEFEPIGAPQDTPFVNSETARKYQHLLAQVTLWRKR